MADNALGVGDRADGAASIVIGCQVMGNAVDCPRSEWRPVFRDSGGLEAHRFYRLVRE